MNLTIAPFERTLAFFPFNMFYLFRKAHQKLSFCLVHIERPRLVRDGDLFLLQQQFPLGNQHKTGIRRHIPEWQFIEISLYKFKLTPSGVFWISIMFFLVYLNYSKTGTHQVNWGSNLQQVHKAWSHERVLGIIACIRWQVSLGVCGLGLNLICLLNFSRHVVNSTSSLHPPPPQF